MVSDSPSRIRVSWMPMANTVPGTSRGRKAPWRTRVLPRNSWSSVARAVIMAMIVPSTATVRARPMLLSSSFGRLAEPVSSSRTVRSV